MIFLMNKPQPMLESKFKRFFVLILLLSTALIYAQEVKDINDLKGELGTITDVQSAKQFIKDHPELNCKIYTYNEEKHVNQLSKKLFTLEANNTLVVKQRREQAIYKIIKITPTTHYRASYIFLDGRKTNVDSLKALRNDIQQQLKNGKHFKDMAGTYSMDRMSHRGGDLGWFTSDRVFPEFIESLNAHKIDEVYSLDMVDKKGYYLIKKTENPKDIRLMTLIKVTL